MNKINNGSSKKVTNYDSQNNLENDSTDLLPINKEINLEIKKPKTILEINNEINDFNLKKSKDLGYHQVDNDDILIDQYQNNHTLNLEQDQTYNKSDKKMMVCEENKLNEYNQNSNKKQINDKSKD